MKNEAMDKRSLRVAIFGSLLLLSLLVGFGYQRQRVIEAQWRVEEARKDAARRKAEAERQEAIRQAKIEAERQRKNILLEATLQGDVEMVRQCLSEGYDPNDANGWMPPLFLAVDDRGLVAWESVMGMEEGERRKFMKAVGEKQVATMRLLVKHGAKVNAVYNDATRRIWGLTPLIHALRSEQSGLPQGLLVRELLKAGANPNQRSGPHKVSKITDGYLVATPLGLVGGGSDYEYYYRAKSRFTREYLEILSDLLRHGAKMEERDWLGRTALIQLCARDHEESALYLLRRGAKATARDNFGLTALHYSVAGETVEVSGKEPSLRLLKALLARGAKINAPDNGGWTPLHVASSDRPFPPNAAELRPAVVKFLLQRGAQANARNKKGRTALHLVAESGPSFDWRNSKRVAVAEMLLRHGAAPNAQDNFGYTPLLCALKGEDYKTNTKEVQQLALTLLRRGAKANYRTPDGTSALKLVPQNQRELRRMLQKWGAAL